MSEPLYAVIGAGPAGLIAAEILSAAGKRVLVFDRMPSVARKFLIAGRGGLNLTHVEPFKAFMTRYGPAQERLRPMVEAFAPADLADWCDGLGQKTYVGSSGRVFPEAMKASPLLRAWLARLAAQGVDFHTRAYWVGWRGAALLFERDGGEHLVHPAATLLALGGASWPKLGADGAWTGVLAARGVNIAPLRPANMGFEARWSTAFRRRFAGTPLKNIALRFGGYAAHGEAMVTAYGLEGGAIYALSAPLRDALATQSPVQIVVDLRPDLTHEAIAVRLARAKRGDSLSSTLRKSLNLDPVSANLLREPGAPPPEAQALAVRIKAVRIMLTAPRGLARAISTAGGVSWSAVDERLALRAIPDTYVAGEMLDWEAPTGGYLLQACFATGAWAARAMLAQAAPSLAAPRPPC